MITKRIRRVISIPACVLFTFGCLAPLYAAQVRLGQIANLPITSALNTSGPTVQPQHGTVLLRAYTIQDRIKKSYQGLFSICRNDPSDIYPAIYPPLPRPCDTIHTNVNGIGTINLRPGQYEMRPYDYCSGRFCIMQAIIPYMWTFTPQTLHVLPHRTVLVKAAGELPTAIGIPLPIVPPLEMSTKTLD